MASTITEITSTIDTGFPVAGQDNDTQGFRNNFANIKIGLERAAEEISELDIVQIGIANRLDGFTNPTTFNGTLVTATVITSETINNSGDITVSGNGRFIGDGSLLSNLNVANVTQISNLTNLTVQNLTASFVNGFTATVYIPNAPAASTGTVGHKQGMIHANSTTVYICYKDYTSTTTNIWARITGLTGSW
jgi:hypothetical protein